MASTDFITVVREFFPDVTDEEAMGILWNYTGYPSFWRGEPFGSCREQLQHLKDVGFEAADAEFESLDRDDSFFADPEFIQSYNEMLRGEGTVVREAQA